MAKKYLESSKVKVFPSAFRGKDGNGKQINPASFLTLEENYANLADKVTNVKRDYFFIDNGVLNIILHGYYFTTTINDIKDMFSNTLPAGGLYVGCSVDDLQISSYEQTDVAKTLKPDGGSVGGTLDDANGIFKALVFGDSSDVAGCNYKLKLFDNDWEGVKESQLNISTAQIIDDESGESVIEKFTTNTLVASSVYASNIYASSSIYTDYLSASSIYGNDVVASSADALTASISSLTSPSIYVGLGGSVYASNSNFLRIYGAKNVVLSTGNSGDMSLIAKSTLLASASAISMYANTFNVSASVGLIGDTFIYGDLNINSGKAIYPAANSAANIGSSNMRFNSGYFNNLYASMGSFTHNLYASSSVTLNAPASKTKLTSGSVGNISTPIYLNNGMPTSCDLQIKGDSKICPFNDATLFSGNLNFGYVQNVSATDVTSIQSWNSCLDISTDYTAVTFSYTLMQKVLKVGMMLRCNELIQPKTWIRIKWDWLISTLLGSSYSPDVNSFWVNSCVVGIENERYNFIDNVLGLGACVRGDYLYIYMNPQNADVGGLCADITCVVTRN